MIIIIKYYNKLLYLNIIFYILSLLGWVTVWDDNNYNVLTIKDEPITNNKQYLKHVKLDDHAITTIIYIQTYLPLFRCHIHLFFF